MPLATGSPAITKTIGIVRVSRCTATVAGVPLASMTSGCKQFPRERSYPIGVTAGPTNVHPHVAAIGPAQVRKRLRELGEASLRQGIVFVVRNEHANAPYAVALLRPRHERPCRRAAE